MAFLGGDHLAELVWSPRKGLVVMSTVGPFGMVHSPPYSVATETTNAQETDLFALLPTNSPVQNDVADEPARLLTSSRNYPSLMQMCRSDLGCDPGSGEKTAEMNTSSQKSNARDDTVSACKGSTFRVFEATGSSSPGVEDGTTSNAKPVSDGFDLNTKPIEFMPGGLTDINMFDMNKDGTQTCPLSPIKGNLVQEEVQANALPRENSETAAGNKLQSPSESDLGIRNSLQSGKEVIQLEACPVSKASPIRYFTTKRKGKEHVIYDCDMKDEEPDSYGSVNSCNGARKRRELNFEEQSNGGCKRVRLEIGDRPVSTSFTRSDGSFVNWISALMKGLSRPSEIKAPSLADADNGSEKKEVIAFSRVQDHKCGNMGFQSLFKTLYQQNPKAQDPILSSPVDPYVSEGCKELEAAEQDPSDCKTALPKRVSSTQNSAMGEHVGCSKKLTVSDKVDESVQRYNQLGHSWLTHFCPKPSAEFARLCHNRWGNAVSIKDGKSKASQGSSSTKGLTDSSCKKLQDYPFDVEVSCAMKTSCDRLKSSETMAYIFSKRLDALKQILQTDKAGKATSSATTCFFCGVNGHDLRDCPQVTDTEVDELVNEVTAYSGAEESPCFCIRCFQLNHWAIVCPNAQMVKDSQLEHGDAVLHHEQTKPVNLEIGDRNVEKVGASYVDENASEDHSLPINPYNSIGRQVVDKPRGIFEAVKGLRLSRADILKWMYSMVSNSYLDGYYLRLRLGKPGEGIEGSGYHVARISGHHGGISVEASKNPISVIVGGVRCSVETQFISNQDFLEEELTAWWSVTKKGGGKLPSEDELRSKLEERRRLGL